ncbi:hypothetical protein D8B29_12195 [Verminephrobacter eiseniae]|nr:hypothetical protein [Verminephrobacter eiseniae]MCW5304292.1 hypothetical protein [Verminephrobacter eiseniae]MCW8180336.1 hypothetical protein [Verminephrobacter eiseniae]MCW8192822.1 hypothetical protein [Verminephrobacter eiseniae]
MAGAYAVSHLRAAASVVFGAYWLSGKHRRTGSIGIVGAGIIARNIIDMFIADDWHIASVVVHDLDGIAAQAMATHVARRGGMVASTLDDALICDVVVFATTARAPYVVPPQQFHHVHQIVLNVSLRDQAPEIILQCTNIVNDVDHCLKVSTSPHLAEERVGHRDFIHGTLTELILGEVMLRSDRLRIFSPFEVGILDLAVGLDIFDQASARKLVREMPGFLPRPHADRPQPDVLTDKIRLATKPSPIRQPEPLTG